MLPAPGEGVSSVAIEVSDLCCRYPEPHGRPQALSGVSLVVHEGDFVVVSGPNGAGKSTLLSCMSGVIPKLISAQVEGSVHMLGRPAEGYDTADLARTLGVVLEDPDSQLFGSTVLRYLAFGPELMGFDPAEILARVEVASRQMGIHALLGRECRTLSGGEKQRAVVASMLVMQPRIMVLDEPSSQLDPSGTRELFAGLEHLNRAYGLTLIIASHNLSELSHAATHLVVLEEGRLRASGRFGEVLGQPLQSLLRYPQTTELYLACRDIGLCPPGAPPVSVDEGVRFIDGLLEGREDGR
jgi:energy-coupling factor transporter ATP-binding protein EcfA2